MAHELVNITQYGPPADVRRKIYLECVADLKEKNASATGSIIVLWALLRKTCLPNAKIDLTDQGFRETA